MPYRIATEADAREIREVSALVMADPDFDIYPRRPQAEEQYKAQAQREQWAVYEDGGAIQGVNWCYPTLKEPAETFHCLAFYTDPTLDDATRARVGLHMVVEMARGYLAAGYRFGDFELPVNNSKVIAFAEWVEPEPHQKRVSGTDPVTGAPHYHRYVWDLARVLERAEKLLNE